jgi:ATP-dependent Zn protease
VAITCRFCGRQVTPLSDARREPQGEARTAGRLFTLVLLLILLVVLGVALLYGYKAQSPSAQPVPYSQAVSEIQAGQVKRVAIAGDSATMVKVDGANEMVTVGTTDSGAFQRVILDYNAAEPAGRQVELSLQKDQQTFGMIGAVLFGYIPAILLVALIGFLALRLTRRGDRR